MYFIDQDTLNYSTELYPSDDSAFSPDLVDNNDFISSCQAQDSTFDTTNSDVLKARDWPADIFNIFQGLPDNTNSDKNGACPNPVPSGSGSGSNNPGTSSSSNNDKIDNERPPTQQPPSNTFLPEIESREDEELCPKKADGIDHIPLCCYSERNLMAQYAYKFTCFRR